MAKHTITRRRTTRARRRHSQPRPNTPRLADRIVQGGGVAWRAFWQDVEHPRLVRGAVLLFPTLALLLVLAHLLLAQLSAAPQEPGQQRPSPTPPPVFSITQRVSAFYRGDPTAGWDNRAQYDLWWPSACSPAALTMDLRVWGASVQIGQVLEPLIAQQAITPQNGLLHAEAVATVAQRYGFQATTFWHWTLSAVAQVTRAGVPVLVDVVDAKQQTPSPDVVVGHWLVVNGVTAKAGQVADSSGYHIRTLSQPLFHILFAGIGLVVWQGALALPEEG